MTAMIGKVLILQIALSLLLTTGVSSAQVISITDLGTLGGSGISSSATAVNDLGQVVGSSDTASGLPHAFSWTAAGGMVDLGTLGGRYSYARAVNNLGQVVGVIYTASGDTRAFSWTAADGMVDLGTLGGTCSEAVAVNNLGQVVGVSYTASGQGHAFSWTAAGGMVDLGTLGGTHSEARAVNDLGQVVGYSYTAAGQPHAFSWTAAGGMVDLGTLGGTCSEAVGVNDLGQVVGTSSTASGERHATLWTVNPPAPAITLTVTLLSTSCTQGSNAPSQSFQVWNSGGGTLNYSISVDTSWLSCDPTSGTSTGESDPITVTYSTSGLTAGTYSATITVADSGASNSPQAIPLTLTVNAPPREGGGGGGGSCFIETAGQETVDGVAIGLLVVLGGAILFVVARLRNTP